MSNRRTLLVASVPQSLQQVLDEFGRFAPVDVLDGAPSLVPFARAPTELSMGPVAFRLELAIAWRAHHAPFMKLNACAFCLNRNECCDRGRAEWKLS